MNMSTVPEEQSIRAGDSDLDLRSDIKLVFLFFELV